MARSGTSRALGRITLLVALSGVLSAPKCFEYEAPGPDGGPDGGGVDAAIDAGSRDSGPPFDSGPLPDGGDVLPTAEGMIAAACLAGRCVADDAVTYWRGDWEDHDVERTIAFADSGTTSSFVVTDATGAPADLSFAPAVPVTLHIVAPGDGSAMSAHDFTAPELLRTVAIRDVITEGATFRAPSVDAVLPVFEAGVEHRATLRFVPIQAGTFTAWSSTGVVRGDRYADIVAGTTTPDLGTGDAGRGMTATVTVTAGDDELTVFQGESEDRDPALDSDPRRDATDPIWDGGATTLIGIAAHEDIDGMTGESVFTFEWTSLMLARDVGHVLELSNDTGNRFSHSFTAQGLMTDSVVRAGRDVDAEVRASYFDSAAADPGQRLQLFVVPTIAREYQTYCRIGVVHAPSGAPDLTTGHAGAGMHDVVTVVP